MQEGLFPETDPAMRRLLPIVSRHPAPEGRDEPSAQLPAFMTSREILQDYKPLPGDYLNGYRNMMHTPGGGTATQVHVIPLAARITGDQGQEHVRERVIRTGETGYVPSRTRPRLQRGLPETADALWARKRKEADESGLSIALADQGVLSPVQLSTMSSDEHTPSRGSKVVLGGHHRIAAMSAANPDALMPVLHYDQTSPDKHDPTYPYNGLRRELLSARTLSEGLKAEAKKREARKTRISEALLP